MSKYPADLVEYLAPRRADVLSSGSRRIVAGREGRRYLAIVNDSDTAIYLAIGLDAEVGRGIRLNAQGGSFEMTDDNLSEQGVWGIHAGTGAKSVTVAEAIDSEVV